MSYDFAIKELRQLLSDTELNKKASKKRLIGDVDGENVRFITYDKRILEDTFIAFVNDEEVDATVEDAIKGLITLADAPVGNVKVSADYYFQWWIDDELATFMNKAAEFLSQSSNLDPEEAWLQIIPGLKQSGLYVAASMALDALVNYMINRRHSEEFLLEQDGNDDEGFSLMIDAMRKQSDAFFKKGTFLRDDFYKRQGKRNAPVFAIKTVRQRNYGPRR